MKRTLALLLALLMLIPMIASCSDNTSESKEETSAADITEAEISETTTGELRPELPKKDFGGEEFLFLTSGPKDKNGIYWETYDVYTESENGDIINDAVYARNIYVNETYNVKINQSKSTGMTLDETQRVVLAGEDVYDAVFTNLNACATLAQTSQTYDMYDIPYIDLENPWWDHNLVKNLSVGGKMNYATGDITVIDNDAIWVLMFNKNMIEDYGLDDLYGLVSNNEWMLDTFIEMAMSVTEDLNGDGKIYWEDDMYAFATGVSSGLTVMYSSGLSFTKKNSDDLPEYGFDIDRGTLIAEKMGKLMGSDGAIHNSDIKSDEVRQIFEEGRALFFGEVLQCMKRMRASDTDFGLVPWPKFDEAQENYGGVSIVSASKAVTVPVTQGNTEMVGIILEAMAAESMYTMTPAYYESALNEKYMRDSESVKMLDIILSNLSVDLAYVYGWGGFEPLVYNSVNNNDGQLVSKIEANINAFNSAMQATIDIYLGK